jgi:hypothetical protein
MKISPYTSYLELPPNALLVRQNFYYLQKVGVTTATQDCQPRGPVGPVTRSLAGPTEPLLIFLIARPSQL